MLMKRKVHCMLEDFYHLIKVFYFSFLSWCSLFQRPADFCMSVTLDPVDHFNIISFKPLNQGGEDRMNHVQTIKLLEAKFSFVISDKVWK